MTTTTCDVKACPDKFVWAPSGADSQVVTTGGWRKYQTPDAQVHDICPSCWAKIDAANLQARKAQDAAYMATLATAGIKFRDVVASGS